MKKLEIQTAISSYLEKKPITLYDLLNTSIKISSYEIFIQELRFVINTFKKIPEYTKSAQEYLTKIDSFIDSCNFEDKKELENYIATHLHNKICGSYSTRITLHVNVNIKMFKKWKIKMYSFPTFIPQFVPLYRLAFL